MNRLKIFCLNNTAEVFTTYVTVPDLVNFISRTGRPKIFSIMAVKGKASLFVDRFDNPYTLESQLNEFNTKNP
jgi:hypothetical protein